EGAIDAAGKAGKSADEAVKMAVGGAVEAADKVGGEAGNSVRNALKSAASLPKDLVEAALK
ncbi:MAG TPA: hypothetical protein VKC54_02795, partial [Patescibacteria group bacterium]|nr:hypothetical protein [Patescibacteria group bacterium]